MNLLGDVTRITSDTRARSEVNPLLQRLGIRVGRLMYLGLLAVGAAALYYWKLTGDLRPYGFVQFYPAVILPLIVVLFPARYSGLRWLILTGVLYLAAKLHEAYDRQISDMIVMGGHPLKHLFAAGALLSYVHMVRTRKRMDEIVIRQ